MFSEFINYVFFGFFSMAAPQPKHIVALASLALPHFIQIVFFSPSIIFDEEGNLWLWHYTGKEEQEGMYMHDVFSPDGIYIKQVVVPHRIHRIKNGKAYCIVINEEDFRFIKRFRFIK